MANDTNGSKLTSTLRAALERVRRIGREVRSSIFRTGRPDTYKKKAEAVFQNLFLHIHPVKVSTNTLRWNYTLGLGVLAFSLFIILLVTGILLMVYYVPSTDQAYNRMIDLRSTVTFGKLIRNMHRWAAHAMIIVVFLHMCRVFYTGSYKHPRQFNWGIGVILLILTLLFSFTGYLLPFDQLAYWAITVGSSIAGYAPPDFVGAETKFVLLGDFVVGQEALVRFYVLHVIVLPVFMTILIAVHFWRIRKDGGLSRPPEPEPKAPVASFEDFETAHHKTYGLQGFVRGTTPVVGSGTVKERMTWPRVFWAEIGLFCLALVGVYIAAVLFDAPLEEPANAFRPPNPSKAPWYFLGLQEMVSYNARWGGVIIPGLVVLVLLAVPYLDRNPYGTGIWFSRRRLVANSVFTVFVIVTIALIIVGYFFRGPNWEFVIPWQH